MTVDSTLAFAARRNIPTRYNRNLLATTLRAMQRVSEIRTKRERVFYRQRMQGNRERQLEADRKLVEENQHLLPPDMRDVPPLQGELEPEKMEIEDEWEGLENEEQVEELDEKVSAVKTTITTRAPKVKKAMRQRLKVDGGMDIDG